jgi:hypothetical protein
MNESSSFTALGKSYKSPSTLNLQKPSTTQPAATTNPTTTNQTTISSTIANHIIADSTKNPPTVEISIRVTMLAGASTFPAWRDQMSHILRSQGMWSLVGSNHFEPTGINQRITFLKDCTRLSGLLLRTIEPDIQRELPLAVRVDGKRLWNAVGEIFGEGQPQEMEKVSRLKPETIGKRKRGTEPMDETAGKRLKKDSAVTAHKQTYKQPHRAKEQLPMTRNAQITATRKKDGTKKKQSPQPARKGAHKARQGAAVLAPKNAGRITKQCSQTHIKRDRNAGAGARKESPPAGYLRATHASAAKGRN